MAIMLWITFIVIIMKLHNYSPILTCWLLRFKEESSLNSSKVYENAFVFESYYINNILTVWIQGIIRSPDRETIEFFVKYNVLERNLNFRRYWEKTIFLRHLFFIDIPLKNY